MKKIIILIVIGILLSILVHFSVAFYGKKYTSNWMRKYTEESNLNTFKESKYQIWFKSKKYDHAVFLIHGYSSSPQAFNSLIPYLKSAEIPFFAPQILGFGLQSTDVLEKISQKDWKRQVLESYDILSQVSKSVSVLGISQGTTLAFFLA